MARKLIGYVLALYIQAQVMKWIYTSGTERKRQNVQKAVKTPGAGSFFSSLFSSLSGSSTPQKTQVALPVVEEKIDHLAISETSVSLSVYSASILVRLDKKLSSEIQRSTKKNPPPKMKFELIYVCSFRCSSLDGPKLTIYRQRRMNMMQVWKKKLSSLKLLAVYSRD